MAAAATAAPAAVPQLGVRWSLDADTEDLLIGDVVDAAVDSAGSIYLLDFRLQEILVVAPDGTVARRIGGMGDGPGETRMAGRLFLEPDGRIGALDLMAAKVTWWAADGTPLSAGHLRFHADGSGAGGIYDAQLGPGGSVAAFMRREVRDGRPEAVVTLARLDADGVADRVLVSAPDRAMLHRGPVMREVDSYNFAYTGWDVDRAGRVYVAAERDRPEVRVFAPDGGESVIAVPTAAPQPRSDAVLARVRRMHADAAGTFEPASAPECIAEIKCDDRDRLWVMSGESRETGAARYEVFAPDGHALDTVDLGAAFDPRFDTAFLVSSRRLVIVTNTSTGGFADDDPEIPRRGHPEMRISCYEFDAGLPGD